MRTHTYTSLLFGIFTTIVLFFGGVSVVSAEEVDASIPSGSGTQAPGINTNVNVHVARTLSVGISEEQQATENTLFKQINCWEKLTDGPSIPGCINVVSYAVYKGASWLLVGGAKFFDFALYLSIDSSFVSSRYGGVTKGFVDIGWELMRDFANMAFIFVLLYAGIQTMFGMGGWQKTVKTVVIVALFINFSLFFSKAIIDAGNVAAVGIYNAMGAAPLTTGAPRELSAALVSSFNPQNFIDLAVQNEQVDLFVILVTAIILNIAVGIAFFKVALVFIGRVIGFWVLMILSPIAFVLLALPQFGNKFSQWLHTLLSLSFVAPVFLFFIYLIMRVIDQGIFQLAFPTNVTGNFITKLLPSIVIATCLYYAINKAVEFAKDMSGTFGSMASDYAGKTLGFAAGGAMGIGAMGLRKGLGGFAASRMETLKAQSTDKKASAESRARAQRKLQLAEMSTKGTWDIRNSRIGGSILKETGVDFGKSKSKGYVKDVEEKKKKFGETMSRVDMSEDVLKKQLQGEIDETGKTLEGVTQAMEAIQAEANSARVAYENSPALDAYNKASAELAELKNNPRASGLDITNAEKKLKTAKESHENSSEYSAYQKAEAAVAEQKKKQQDAQEAHDSAKETLDNKQKFKERLNKENTLRRTQYAQDMLGVDEEGKSKGAYGRLKAFVSTGAMTESQRQAYFKAGQKGKKEKDPAEDFKKWVKEQEEKEHSGGGDEKKSGGHTETHSAPKPPPRPAPKASTPPPSSGGGSHGGGGGHDDHH